MSTVAIASSSASASSVGFIRILSSNESLNKFKNLLLLLFVTKHVRATGHFIWKYLRVYGMRGSLIMLWKDLLQRVIQLTRKFLPAAERQVQKEVSKSVEGIQKDMMGGSLPGQSVYYSLPEKGLKYNQVIEELDTLAQMGNVDWRSGKVSGTIYHGGKDLSRLLTEAFSLFTLTNPLHPEVWPGVRKMEAEICSMCVEMYKGGADACGSITSGGTESILMSIKAHRDYYRYKKNIQTPNLIIPESAHAAFDKGAHYFDLELIKIPIDQVTGCVDLIRLERAIDSNTVLIVGSTPGYPHGSIDDIPALGKLALKYGVGLHVDSCLGGFLVPFAAEAGFPLPFQTDFRVKGVTAISCDTHKYGFAPKGSSVIMYSNATLRKHQYFLQPDWLGGVYGSPTMAGSRPGSLSAGCWAAMIHFGRAGYVESTRKILQSAKDIKEGLSKIPGLEVIGEAHLSVVAFRTKTTSKVNIYGVAQLLKEREYHLAVLQFPPSIHIACTLLTPPLVPTMIKDMKEIMEILTADPKKGEGSTAAIYGTAATVPDRSIIGDVVAGFLDGLTMLPKKEPIFN